mgnify:CR=1 FL=1
MANEDVAKVNHSTIAKLKKGGILGKGKEFWSANAEDQLRQILDYFTSRNKSGTYYRKLFSEFSRVLLIVTKIFSSPSRDSVLTTLGRDHVII